MAMNSPLLPPLMLISKLSWRGNTRILFSICLKKTMVAGIFGSSKKKEIFCQDQLLERVFKREGKVHFDFHVRLANSLERGVLNTNNLPSSVRKYFMG